MLSRSSAGPAGGGGGGMGGCDEGERASGVLAAPTYRLVLIAGGAGACDSERTVTGTACANGAACAARAWLSS